MPRLPGGRAGRGARGPGNCYLRRRWWLPTWLERHRAGMDHEDHQRLAHTDPRGSPGHPECGGPQRSSCGCQGRHALLWRGGAKGRRGALDSGWGPSVLWSGSRRGCCAAWPLGRAAAGPARALLGVPSSSVLKPYLGEQKADRHIRSRDRPDHRAGASAAPIRRPAWPPGLWSVRPRAAPAGPFSANESLGPGKRGGARTAASGPEPSTQPTDFWPPAPAPAPAYVYPAPNARQGWLTPPDSWAHVPAGELTWIRGSGIPV